MHCTAPKTLIPSGFLWIEFAGSKTPLPISQQCICWLGNSSSKFSALNPLAPLLCCKSVSFVIKDHVSEAGYKACLFNYLLKTSIWMRLKGEDSNFHCASCVWFIIDLFVTSFETGDLVNHRQSVRTTVCAQLIVNYLPILRRHMLINVANRNTPKKGKMFWFHPFHYLTWVGLNTRLDQKWTGWQR